MNTTILYEAEVTRESRKALCCRLDNDHIDHWIPRGQIQPGSAIRRPGNRGTLIVTEWFKRTANLPTGVITSMPHDQPNPNTYPDTGSLFKNDRKQSGTKQPDYNGKLDIVCEHCGVSFTRKLAAWIREAKTGRKFLSLSFKPAPQDGDSGHAQGRQRFDQQVQAIGTPLDGPAEEDDLSF